MAFKRNKTRRRSRIIRPKICRFCEENIHYIDFKNVYLLTRYVTEQGKMIPRRITGNCALHQKILSRSIKRSRSIALML